MNIFQKIWYFFFPKPVPPSNFWDRRLLNQFSEKTPLPPIKMGDTVKIRSTSTGNFKRPIPHTVVPPAPPRAARPRPQSSYDSAAAERRIREESRRRDDETTNDLISVGLGIAIGSMMSDSSSSFSDVSSSVDTTESWSGGGGESGGGGSSGDW